MKIGDIMTPNVLSVREDATLVEALRLMMDNRVSGLTVVDAAGSLVGVVTEGDLLRRAETGTEQRRPRWIEFLTGSGKLAGDYVRSHARRVGELMSTDPKTISEDAALPEAVDLMIKHRFRRLPVMRGNELVGIVSRADIVKALYQNLDRLETTPQDDAAILSAINAEIARNSWFPRDTVSVTVENGIVQLNGTIFAESERDAVRVMAENVPGVRGIVDHMSWIEPVSGIVVLPSPEDEKPSG